MTYKYTVRRYALARKMAADHHKGGPYKLSEFGHIWLPAAETAIEYMAEALRIILHMETHMIESEVEVYLYNDGFIKIKPEIKL